MPIVQRPPGPTESVAVCPEIGDIALQGPSGVLLHPGGPWALPPQPDPDIRLAAAAALLVRFIDRRGRRPIRWTAAAFAREVELIRSHLRPIRNPATLAASFGREALHGTASVTQERAISASAVTVAYAIRWLELNDGRTVPGWAAWLGGADHATGRPG